MSSVLKEPETLGFPAESEGSGVFEVGPAEREVTAYAVHDAKNVLGAMVANVDWLQGVLADHPVAEVQEALKDVLLCCNRLNGLLREALHPARGAARAIDGLSPVRLSVIAATAAETIRRRAESRGVAVDLAGREDDVMLADESTILRLLGNLLDNAIRFCAPRGRITLAYGSRGNAVFFSVADDGPGIPSGQQEQVFQPFHTTGVGPGDNAGLGLAFCRKVAREHGGEVSVSNRPGGGALFIVTLPRQRP